MKCAKCAAEFESLAALGGHSKGCLKQLRDKGKFVKSRQESNDSIEPAELNDLNQMNQPDHLIEEEPVECANQPEIEPNEMADDRSIQLAPNIDSTIDDDLVNINEPVELVDLDIESDHLIEPDQPPEPIQHANQPIKIEQVQINVVPNQLALEQVHNNVEPNQMTTEHVESTGDLTPRNVFAQLQTRRKQNKPFKRRTQNMYRSQWNGRFV